MKRLLLSLAISAAAITGPAVAQAPDNRYQDRPGSYRDDDGGRGNISSRIEQLRERIEEGVRSGAISRREALSLRSSLRSLTELDRHDRRCVAACPLLLIYALKAERLQTFRVSDAVRRRKVFDARTAGVIG